MLELERYRACIFDFDGVLADTNGLKARNIRRAAEKYCNDPEKIDEFVEHFTAGFGVPREEKIARFFPPEQGRLIQDHYNRLNLADAAEMKLTPGAKEFIELLRARGIERYVVSGSDPSEIHPILRYNDAEQLFAAVRGAPLRKKENIKELSVPRPVLFIGDSKVDHETAQHSGFDFVFLYQFTHFSGWREYFADYPEALIAASFEELLSPTH